MSCTDPPVRAPARQAGQSLIESCLAIALVCLIFMGLFQVSQVFAAREILSHAAARGARARTVGLNRWMVRKCVRVACIPNAGEMLVPDRDSTDTTLLDMVNTLSSGELWDQTLAATPQSEQYQVERVRIPDYLDSENHARGGYLLDYEDWDTVHSTVTALPGDPPPPVHAVAWQGYPLTVPLHRTFFAADSVELTGESYLEQHYPLYLDDQNW